MASAAPSQHILTPREGSGRQLRARFLKHVSSLLYYEKGMHFGIGNHGGTALDRIFGHAFSPMNTGIRCHQHFCSSGRMDKPLRVFMQ